MSDLTTFCDVDNNTVGFAVAAYVQTIDPVTCATSYSLVSEYYDTDFVSVGTSLPDGWQQCCCESGGGGGAETVTTITDTVSGNKIGTYTNELGTPVDINETITALGYNPATNILTYTDETGASTNVDLTALAIDINVGSLAYNPLTGVITLTETDGSVHTIDISTLIDVYTVSDTDTVDLTMTGNNITGVVRIDPDSCNTISATASGLIVKPERYRQIRDTNNNNSWLVASAGDVQRVTETANDCGTEPITFLIQGDTTAPGNAPADIFLDRPKVYPNSDTVVFPQLKVRQTSTVDGAVRLMSATPVGTILTVGTTSARVSKPTMATVVGEGEAFTITPITQTVPFEEFQWAYDLYVDGVFVQGGNQLFQLKNNLITPAGSQMLCNTWGSFFFQTVLQPGATRSVSVRMRVAINNFTGTNLNVQWMKSEHRLQVVYV